MPNASLAGRYFLNTRPRRQAADLTSLLAAKGARVLEVPGVEIVFTAAQLQALSEHLLQSSTRDWVVFTSANGVAAVSEAERIAPGCGARIRGMPTACIGEKTAAAAVREGLTVQFISSEANSRSFARQLAAFLKERRNNDIRLYLLRGGNSNAELPDSLMQSDFEVVDLEVYQAQAPDVHGREAQALCQGINGADGQALDMMIFTSAQCVRNIDELVRFRAKGDSELTAFRSCPVATMGQLTASAARDALLNVQVEAPALTIESLVDAVIASFG